MNTLNNNVQKNKLLIESITTSDTLSQFMEKCNNNFSTLVAYGGGPDGKQGEKGDQGIPTKPKVPIHAWKQGVEYMEEKEKKTSSGITFELKNYNDLSDSKYKEGHLIILENGHVYILEVVDTNDLELKPKFAIALQTFDPSTIIDGKTAYVHIAYSNAPDGSKDFITNQDLRKNEEKTESEIETTKYYEDIDNPHDDYEDNENTNVKSYSSNKLYMGIYCDHNETPPGFLQAYKYTWIRMRNLEYDVILSDPFTVIPVWDDNSCEDTNTDYSTFVYVYDNLTDISSYNSVSISYSLPDDISKHFTAVKEKNINKIIFSPIVKGESFNFGTNNQYKLPITLSYNFNKDVDDDISNIDIYTKTINWTLIPNKSINAKIFVNKNIVNTSISREQNFEVGYYLISPNGNKKIIDNNNTNNNRNYQILLTNDIENLNSYKIISDWKNASYTFSENENCYVVLVDTKDDTDTKNWSIIDYTTISTVNDGISATYLDLLKDHIILPYNIDGTKIHPDYNTSLYPIQSQMLLYNGDELIKNDVIYKIFKTTYEQSEENEYYKIDTPIYDINISSDGVFEIPTDIIDGNTELKCIASYNGNDYQKTLFIELKETPYKFEFNKNILSRGSNDSIRDTELIVYVKYYMNGKWVTSTNEEDKNVAIIASWGDNKTQQLSYNEVNNYHRISINKNNFKNNTSIYKVEISCYKNASETDNVIFKDTISIINDGKNSSDGLDINDQNNEIKIDKNGIVIKTNDETNNIDTIFNVQNGEILLKVGNYGIKITSSGISTTSSNGETWTQLNQ